MEHGRGSVSQRTDPGDGGVRHGSKLVDYATKNPGKLSYSTTGSGGATHLVGELFNQVAGIQAVATMPSRSRKS